LRARCLSSMTGLATPISSKLSVMHNSNYKKGVRNPECLTWGVDKRRVLRGRTGVEVNLHLFTLRATLESLCCVLTSKIVLVLGSSH
jgi:hypothetical protein